MDVNRESIVVFFFKSEFDSMHAVTYVTYFFFFKLSVGSNLLYKSIHELNLLFQSSLSTLILKMYTHSCY